MTGYYRHRTSAGEFRIVQERSGRWQAMYGDEGLGSYEHPWQAAEDLAGGHTFMPSCGDTAALGLPDELAGWELVRNR